MKRKTPHPQRVREMEYLRKDPLVMRVYCDASISPKEFDQYGIAAVFVFHGDVTVRYHKDYRRAEIAGFNQYAELAAVYHALRLLDSRIQNTRLKPRRVVVYTDNSEIANFQLYWMNLKALRELANDATIVLENLRRDWPEIKFSIEYLEVEARENLYYRTAHHAARQAILH